MSNLNITVRSVSDSPVIRYHINKYYSKLLKHYPNVQFCKVVIDTSQNHRYRGKVFSVSIDLAVPKKEIASKKYNLNLFVAIREAFQALEKSLNKHNKRKLVPIKNYVDSRANNSWPSDDPHYPRAS